MNTHQRTRGRRTRQPRRGETGGTCETEPEIVPLTVSRPELLVDGSDQTFRRLIHGLLAFFALHEAIRDSYAAHVGLGGVQYTILQSIRHLAAGRSVGVSEVAAHLRLSGAFITIETKKLQQLGLIERCQSTVDRRRVLLAATSKGAKLLNDLAPLQRAVNDVQFADLSREQFRELVTLVERLIESSQDALTLLHYIKGSKGRHRLARLTPLGESKTCRRDV